MILGVIPARGGSKRLPGKNLRMLGGKTLLQWAIESAQAVQQLDALVVSTEDSQIIIEAQRLDVTVLKRPFDLAADTTPMLEVLRHVASLYPHTDILVVLQPTTPFRTSALIEHVLTAMEDADSIVTTWNNQPTGEVYVTRRETLLNGRLMGPGCKSYPHRPIVNIDTEYDLVRAEQWIRDRSAL